MAAVSTIPSTMKRSSICVPTTSPINRILGGVSERLEGDGVEPFALERDRRLRDARGLDEPAWRRRQPGEGELALPAWQGAEGGVHGVLRKSQVARLHTNSPVSSAKVMASL